MSKKITVKDINLHTFYDFINISKSSTCGVCENLLLHKFNLTDKNIIVLGKCGHMYHKSCVDNITEFKCEDINSESPHLFETIKELDSEIVMRNNQLHLKSS